MRIADCGIFRFLLVLVLLLVLDLTSISCSIRKETDKLRKITLHEDFSRPVTPAPGKSFGSAGQLTFELFRGGTFIIDGGTSPAVQHSASYRDSAWIRTTHPLPETYKVSVVAGEVEYDLASIEGLAPDSDYREGPPNENGCYLLAITDELPSGHHTNDWWHQHRKLVIDVDNNIWGHGMPNPIFMVYFDLANRLVSYNGSANQWQAEWVRGVQYEKGKYYRIEMEKTKTQYILSVSTEGGMPLKSAEIEREKVWHNAARYPEYFVVGDPHENYYQGSMKIKSITIEQ